MGLLGLSCERKTWDDLIYTLSHDKAWPSHLQRSNHRPKLQCESVTYLDTSQNLFSYHAVRSEDPSVLNIRTAGFHETLVPNSQTTRRYNSKVLNIFSASQNLKPYTRHRPLFVEWTTLHLKALWLVRVKLNGWIVTDELETTDYNPIKCVIAVLSSRTNKTRAVSLTIARVWAETWSRDLRLWNGVGT